MIVRTVLAVVLTVALLGVSLPAIDDARRDHAETAVREELRRVEQAARSLLETDDPTTGTGARRVVTIRLPTESWRDEAVERVVIAGGSGNEASGRFTWTIEGGPQEGRNLLGLPLATPDSAPVTLDSPGRHRLVLSLDGTPANPTVTVRRFKSDEAANPAHATVAPHDIR